MLNRQDITGQILGQYELRAPIGTGGMAVVYRAYQRSLKRDVAVKVLTPLLAAQSGYLERFNQEAETAAALEHPHIVPIHDYGTVQGISYVVMRLLLGGTLAERIDQRIQQPGQPLPALKEISRLLNQLASALDYAHSLGVIHRDIKPNNIMFDHHGTPFLVDFGIAKLLETSNPLTTSTSAFGTPPYMPPEQWRGEELTPAADQYALGIVAYALVTGDMPFQAPTLYAMMHRHLNEIPTPAHLKRPDVPETVTAVLARALSKDPKDRWPTTGEFAQAFETAIQTNMGESTDFFVYKLRPKTGMPALSSISVSQVPPEKRSSESYLLVAALLLASLAVLAYLLLGLNEPDEDKQSASNPSITEEEIAAPLTETPSPSITSTASLTSTRTRTPTETLTPTPTLDPLEQIKLELTETAVSMANLITTLTATHAKTETLNPTEIYAETRQAFIATLTATSFTATPSATSTPTDTPTPTRTPTQTHTPSPTPFSTLTSNANWQQVISSEFDGVEMVLVPPGCFVMGSDDGAADEMPTHEQCFDAPFWIDRYEVSNAQFEQFGGEAARNARFREENMPRDQITWFEARDFCQQRGGRLPTEAEWEYAARGPDNLTYPWGNEFVTENTVYVVNSYSQPDEVGSRPDGASWVGTMDMSGNVAEWVSSIMIAYPHTGDNRHENADNTWSARAVRGGSFENYQYAVRSSFRDSYTPATWEVYIGFRCVRPFEEPNP